ncbi:expressed unknown protein [Seminavis robusta]|uniref:Protein kinase domain-containing protein n=1 Tax=Seminavis robusta TaxID=568900 RepID=A0A9N8HN40_9STRA|nr:expressed unknown protein [Seminavis robusta]|eukprot:Sro793_g203270.1 n/a (533) ;mRNA; f:29727-31545
MLPLLIACLPLANAFVTQSVLQKSSTGARPQHQIPLQGIDADEWESDFDDFDDSNDDVLKLSDVLQSRGADDLSACRSRQLSLGRDFVLSDFVGNMGFDEVTDWEYYYENEDDENDRKVVQPNPFDSATPRRTRSSSGSVIRLFRGELVGPLGGSLSAQGYDRRVLIKEFSGDMAMELARNELFAIAKLQSNLLRNEQSAQDGDWYRAASSRSVMERQDNNNVARLMHLLRDSPFVGILGECNLAEIDDMDPNEFYRAMSVKPPKPSAIWIIYEYPGMASVANYAQPAELRRQAIPPKKGFFGAVDPPPLPKFEQRANYVVKGILKGALEAMALQHDVGLVHRSIGRSSILLSSKAMDKREASSPYTTFLSQLHIKMADFGFAGLLEASADDPEFCTRARTFGLSFAKGERSIAVANFAIAEDMHALGFVAVGLLLSSLAEIKSVNDPVPATDEDTLQRLLGDIFDKDIAQFREYVEAEEVWANLVELLDRNDSAGWKVLETLFMARERAAKFKDSELILTARGLLSSPFFE